MVFLGYEEIPPRMSEHEAAEALRRRMYAALAGGAEPPVCREAGGKPYYAYGAVRFSVSHSGSAAACVLSVPGVVQSREFRCLDASPDAPEVGVDIERIRDTEAVDRLRRIAARFFPAPMRARLADIPEAAFPRAFCDAWTICESTVKMTGQGFGRGFGELDFDGVRLVRDTILLSGEEYCLCTALCAARGGESI